MTEFQSIFPELILPPNYYIAMEDLSEKLTETTPNKVLTLGDSVRPEAEYLRGKGFQTIQLDNREGLKLYQLGTMEDQEASLLRYVRPEDKVAVVEDVPISGGKLHQIKMVFDYVGIPFNAFLLAAEKGEDYSGVTVISRDPELLSFLRKRGRMIREFRNQKR